MALSHYNEELRRLARAYAAGELARDSYRQQRRALISRALQDVSVGESDELLPVGGEDPTDRALPALVQSMIPGESGESEAAETVAFRADHLTLEGHPQENPPGSGWFWLLPVSLALVALLGLAGLFYFLATRA